MDKDYYIYYLHNSFHTCSHMLPVQNITYNIFILKPNKVTQE